MNRLPIAVVVVVLSSVATANAQQDQQHAPQALELPARPSPPRPIGEHWVMLLPPLKPNPFASGQWSIDYAAPSERWTADDAIFSSEQNCRDAVTQRGIDLQQGRRGVVANSMSQMQALAAEGDRNKIMQEFNDTIKKNDDIYLLQSQVEYAKCVQR